jgi:ribosomal protein S18 acetylase RimI-like enzyme
MVLHLSLLKDEQFPLIHRAFLEAFSDYQVDMSQVTEEVLRNRCIKNAVELESSVGVFDGERVIGFTLVGIDSWKGVPAAFDAGSGIIKGFRGKGLAKQMFDFAVPNLKARGVKKFLLEVIQDNEQAIKAYKKSGFHVSREFDCFEWDVTKAALDEKPGLPWSVETVGQDILPAFRESLDWEPSWENSFSAVGRIPDEVWLFGAVADAKPMGILVYYPLLNWIMTLAVKKAYRRKGVATSLLTHFLKHLKQSKPERETVKLLNVDRSDAGMLAFLARRGFRLFISQYEMERDL